MSYDKILKRTKRSLNSARAHLPKADTQGVVFKPKQWEDAWKKLSMLSVRYWDLNVVSTMEGLVQQVEDLAKVDSRIQHWWKTSSYRYFSYLGQCSRKECAQADWGFNRYDFKAIENYLGNGDFYFDLHKTQTEEVSKLEVPQERFQEVLDRLAVLYKSSLPQERYRLFLTAPPFSDYGKTFQAHDVKGWVTPLCDASSDAKSPLSLAWQEWALKFLGEIKLGEQWGSPNRDQKDSSKHFYILESWVSSTHGFVDDDFLVRAVSETLATRAQEDLFHEIRPMVALFNNAFERGGDLSRRLANVFVEKCPDIVVLMTLATVLSMETATRNDLLEADDSKVWAKTKERKLPKLLVEEWFANGGANQLKGLEEARMKLEHLSDFFGFYPSEDCKNLSVKIMNAWESEFQMKLLNELGHEGARKEKKRAAL